MALLTCDITYNPTYMWFIKYNPTYNKNCVNHYAFFTGLKNPRKNRVNCYAVFYVVIKPA